MLCNYRFRKLRMVQLDGRVLGFLKEQGKEFGQG